MIIKGGARGGAVGLAKHLERDDTNERVQLKELRGVVADNLTDALYEMGAMGSAAETKRYFYHASINAEPGQMMTDAQWQESIDALEKKMGLEGQPRIVVEHGKKGREHVHVVWMRVDLEQMKGISDSHNYRKHEEVARDLERRFGHDRVQGAHAERDGKPRPDRTPSHDEMQQAERTRLTPQQAKEWINTLWHATDSGKAFKAALESQGWALARGDRRDFVLVDMHGETHSLARRVDGRAAAVRARMSDIDRDSLPTVAQAKQQQRTLQADRSNQQERSAARGPDRQEPHRDPMQDAQQQEARRQSQIEKEQQRREAPRAQPDQSKDPGNARTSSPPSNGAGLDAAADAITDTGLMVHDAAAGVTMKLTSFVGGLLGAFLNPGGSLGAAYSTESAAERATSFAAQRREAAGLSGIRDSLAHKQPLKAEDVRSLSRDTLENIRAGGDAALLDMIRRIEQEQAREHERGRTREL